MMRRIRLMCVFAMTAYAAVNASAQSFTVTADDGTDMVAGRPHLMRVTLDNGAGSADASYSGPKTVNAWYTWNSPVGNAKDPKICVLNPGAPCPSPADAAACPSATASSIPLPGPLTFDGGVAKFCLVAPDVGKFSVGVNDASLPAVPAVPSPLLTARPDHFDLTVAPLTDRSELSCSDSSFTYMGEPIGVTFTLTAMNQVGVKTDNYAGDFVKFSNNINDSATWTTLGTNNMGLWMVATGYPVGTDTCKVMFSDATPSETSFACTDPANNPTSISRAAGPRVTISAPSMSWTSGVGAFTVNVVLERADLRDGHYEFVSIGIAPVDNDGVKLLPTALVLDANNDGTNERASLGSTNLRYGRFKIPNAYGSELLPLPIGVQAQYWARNAYVSNDDDDCTPLAGGSFIKAQAQGAVITTAVAGTGTLTDGRGRIALTKPSPAPAGKGAVDVSSQLSYLPGTGRATFGVYKGGPVIYLRELHY